jgi:hypothetical protein
MIKRIGFILAIITCSFLAACGGSSAPLVKADIDPCSLVSEQDASQIFGKTMTAKPGKPIEIAGSKTVDCQYQSPDLAFGSVSLVIYQDANTARTGFDQLKNIKSTTDVSDLGEGAYTQGTPSAPILTVLKSNVILMTSAVATSGQTSELERKLAETALKHL